MDAVFADIQETVIKFGIALMNKQKRLLFRQISKADTLLTAF